MPLQIPAAMSNMVGSLIVKEWRLLLKKTHIHVGVRYYGILAICHMSFVFYTTLYRLEKQFPFASSRMNSL